ncbi:MAG: tRNA (guanosine(46)-N7)-methyltransferase TrmB [Spirochaetales bacterium]|nr:tRNA (guanosine(46)-N7)-methyltransferase TrmB [Spirochaetales bacterium]
MSPAQQSAYNRLFDTFSYPYKEEILQRDPKLTDRDMIIEIGFGMGDATYQIAMENPDKDYLGIEVYKPGIGKLLDQIEQNNIRNLRVIEHDAVEVLGSMIEDSSIQGFHIFFPDPWPKKKHHKRRIIQPAFVKLLQSKLIKGGYLYAVTDWENYAEHMLSVLEAEEGLTNKYSEFADPQEWRPFTKFERKGKEKSHRIFELLYIKN